mmetsp:Transcript_38819/g.93181  ORF Transcript_38819/g.93181 Transcript_38819/m.93181 type:complete len:84 (+) Transcript_38819:613-864(+)
MARCLSSSLFFFGLASMVLCSGRDYKVLPDLFWGNTLQYFPASERQTYSSIGGGPSSFRATVVGCSMAEHKNSHLCCRDRAAS